MTSKTSMETLDSKELWAPFAASDDGREKLWSKQRSFAQDVWFRFRRKKTALLGLILIGLSLLFALVGPLCVSRSYSDQNLEHVSIPPFFFAYTVGEGEYLYLTTGMKPLQVAPDGTLGVTVTRIQDDAFQKKITYEYGDRVITVDYAEKPPAILDDAGERMTPDKFLWNRTYPLGSDGLGRDVLVRLMYGARISLLVAFVAAAINLVIGVLYGGISGYCGGNVDMVMMRIVDVISTIPLTLYVILIMVVMGQGLQSIIVALSSVYWVDMARVVRGQVLSLKGQEFVYAARTIGSSTGKILIRHLIPNAMGPILVTATMLIPSAIFMEAFLSFIGLGIPAPNASLGTMCNDAIEALRVSPYQLFFPALAICIIMFAFNFVGDGLRDALDPKLKK